MKILLIGEFSGLHSNLMKGLIKLGCHVDMISYGDTFKKFDSGINVSSVRKFPFSTFDNELNIPFRRLVKKLGKYDVVQFINPLVTHTRLQIAVKNLSINNELILNLIEKADKSFLLAAGDDHYYINAIENNLLKYHPFNDYLKYDMPPYKRWFNQCWNNEILRSWNKQLVNYVNGVIPCAYEYDLAYTFSGVKNKKDYIPFPFDIDSVNYSENAFINRLRVVHGLNRYGVKGTRHVEAAFDNLKHHNDISCEILKRLSYNEFCERIQKSNVVIDQLYSLSYGYSAITALAMGKIAISGSEKEVLNKYGIKECSALINGTPDSNDLTNKIIEIYGEVEKLKSKGKEGRDFIFEYHDYVKIAEKYLHTWCN